MLRNYCNNNQQVKSARIGFVAPLFRYRDGPTRHFSQIGYAAINEALPSNAVDFSLLQLIGAMTSLCQKSNLTIQVFINDFNALRTMLSDGGISDQEMPDVLHSLQFSTLEQRANLLRKKISNPHVLSGLLDVLTVQRFGQSLYRDIHEMALQHLGQKEFSVVYGGIPTNLAKAIRKVASDGYTHLTILGDAEETSSEISVKELSQRTTQTMVIPSQKP